MKLETFINQARGGKVVRTAFIEATQIDRKKIPDDVKVLVSGGFADALRIVATFYPDHIPHIDDPVGLYRLNIDLVDVSIDELKVALNLPAEFVGDLRQDKGSFVIAVTGQAIKMLEALKTIDLQGRNIEIEVEKYTLDEKSKTKTVVVPSLRVDVVGAKGFGVSRSYFQAGIAGRKVRLNGQIATSSNDISEGDVLTADGLGRVEFKRVISETKRGNYKIELINYRSN